METKYFIKFTGNKGVEIAKVPVNISCNIPGVVTVTGVAPNVIGFCNLQLVQETMLETPENNRMMESGKLFMIDFKEDQFNDKKH